MATTTHPPPALGINSVREPDFVSTTGNATALGRGALAKALDATAVGASAQTAFSGSAFGQNSQALGDSSTAVGKAVQALATRLVAIGVNSFAGNQGTSSGSILSGVILATAMAGRNGRRSAAARQALSD
jgi:hypothetical protein